MFKRVTSTFGWSILSRRLSDLWVGTDGIKRGVQSAGGPSLTRLYVMEPHMLRPALASLDTMSGVPSSGAKALCQTPRAGEDMDHSISARTYSHHYSATEERSSLYGRRQTAVAGSTTELEALRPCQNVS